MSRRDVSARIVALLLCSWLCSWLCSGAMAQSCPARPSAGEKPRRYTGRYQNWAYGFATTIPPGMVGLDADDPDYQRGFFILLPRAQGTLRVAAETNSEDATDLHGVAAARAGYLGKRAASVGSEKYERERRGGRAAERVSARFKCVGNPASYGYFAAFSMDRSRRFLYSIEWEGPLAEAASAQRTASRIEGTWRYLHAR